MSQRRRRTSRSGIMHRFLLPIAPDVLGLLRAQAEVSVRALASFASWSHTADAADAEAVRNLEHEADDARRRLVEALRRALVTPIDQEDLYVLSERLDRVVNLAKNITSEAGALGWVPDAPAGQMADTLRQGVELLAQGFGGLADEPSQVGELADQAVHQARIVEHTYRSALADAIGEPDLRALFTTRELYRSYARCAEAVVSVADRLWYALLAES
jgi:hypothetical protein